MDSDIITLAAGQTKAVEIAPGKTQAKVDAACPFIFVATGKVNGDRLYMVREGREDEDRQLLDDALAQGSAHPCELRGIEGVDGIDLNAVDVRATSQPPAVA